MPPKTMDITKLVRTKRRCGIYAWAGYIVASFLAVFALGMPWLYSIVVALFIVSYITTRASRIGAMLHSTLIGLFLLLVMLEEPKGRAFISANRWMALFLLIALIWSLMGVKASFTYHRLLPQGQRDKNTPSIAKWISRKLSFLSSTRKRAIVLSYLWAIACLLPLLVPFIIWAFTGIDTMVKWFEGSNVLFWFVVGGYAFAAGPCLTGVYYFYTKAKRAAAISFQEMHARDHRPPILLLRSFQDDLTPIARRLPFSSFQPSDHYRGAWTFEEAVENTFRHYGPVIAIGRPGEKLPPAGAAREYVSNEKWQDRIKEFLSEAKLVVVIAGKTAGLDWEYQQLARLKVWKRLVIMFPPVEEGELMVRWSHFQQTTAEKIGRKEQDKVSNALLATFDHAGTPRFVTCKWRNDEECYRLAIQCGLTERYRDQQLYNERYAEIKI
jgi:hypothetical protein